MSFENDMVFTWRRCRDQFSGITVAAGFQSQKRGRCRRFTAKGCGLKVEGYLGTTPFTIPLGSLN